MGTMNAVENVALPLTFQGVDKDIRLKRASRVLDLVGLKEHKKHKPTQMSGGQQQRVGVARACLLYTSFSGFWKAVQEIADENLLLIIHIGLRFLFNRSTIQDIRLARPASVLAS